MAAIPFEQTFKMAATEVDRNCISQEGAPAQPVNKPLLAPWVGSKRSANPWFLSTIRQPLTELV